METQNQSDTMTCHEATFRGERGLIVIWNGDYYPFRFDDMIVRDNPERLYRKFKQEVPFMALPNTIRKDTQIGKELWRYPSEDDISSA